MEWKGGRGDDGMSVDDVTTEDDDDDDDDYDRNLINYFTLPQGYILCIYIH